MMVMSTMMMMPTRQKKHPCLSRLKMAITFTGAFTCIYALLVIITGQYSPCFISSLGNQTTCNWPSLPISLLLHPSSSSSSIETPMNLSHIVQGNSTPINLPSNQPSSSSSSSSSLSSSSSYVSSIEPPLNFSHIVFGVAASASLWETRKEFIKLWWRSDVMRGYVWLDKPPMDMPGAPKWESSSLPPWKISEDTSQFKYTFRNGYRSAIRISRIPSEMVRLGLEGEIRWLVMGDDDTIFIPENLLRVLSKYDHQQYYYIGSNSESHFQNIKHSYNMAYGGGGFAISYPLALALEKMQDQCLKRYPELFGSDVRIQACLAELGVPLTRETGFHQFDFYGSMIGILAAHPQVPVVSLHHLDTMEPIFPNQTHIEALQHFSQAMKVDPSYLLQQSICYDEERVWSISIAWGYVVQVFQGIYSPRDLEIPLRTFTNWYKRAGYISNAFNTRTIPHNPCLRPTQFFMEQVRKDEIGDKVVVQSSYEYQPGETRRCKWIPISPTSIQRVNVMKDFDEDMWTRAPRRKCCRVVSVDLQHKQMDVHVGDCEDGEIMAVKKPIPFVRKPKKN